MMTLSNLETQLRRSIRRGRVLTAPAQLAGYDADGLGYKTFRPDAVVIPADIDELILLLRSSSELDVPVTIRGAGTSLSGGPVAAQGGVVVHTSALRKIRHISEDGFWCEAECSVTLNQLDAALRPHRMFYPPDPSSGPVCTLGGNVAMNAGGAHCFRYGVTSNYVLGLEAVLLDGSVHRFGGPAGGRGEWQADWKRLMVGSEGTLGAFTRFWLRTLPRAEKAWTFRATFPDLQSAERAIHALVAHPSFPVAIELMDPRCVAMVENSPMAVGLPKDVFLLVTEIEGPAVLVNARMPSVTQLLRDSGSLSVEYSDDELQRNKLWKARKVAGGLMGQLSPDFLVQDAVIPKRALAELLQLVYDEADAAGIPAVNVFHAGDGNLHPNFMFDSSKPGELERVEAISKRLMHRVVEVGGTLSGEHGIGNDKTAYMPLVFTQETLKLQLAVPAAFNPRHQLNPLKVFGGRKFVSAKTNGSFVEAAPSVVINQKATTSYNEEIGSRLFVPFLDSIDGIACVSASVTASELTALLEPHQLRFPLVVDSLAPLWEQVATCEFAPASSRFGPFCDNIVGMNWQLPNGRVVRIGERVVKSTTGYDLLRFLLHADQCRSFLPERTFAAGEPIVSTTEASLPQMLSGDTGGKNASPGSQVAASREVLPGREDLPGSQFGKPIDFVLRLRPDCGMDGVFVLSGDADSITQAAPVLLQSCWMNWFDSVDVVADGRTRSLSIRIAINTPASEWPVFEIMLASFAERHHLSLAALPDEVVPMDGCPDFAMKTTPDRAVALARDIANQHRLTCLALCYNGVVHGYFSVEDNHSKLTQNVIEQFASHLHEVGGDWRSRHLPSPIAKGIEAQWLEVLTKEFVSI